MTPNPIQATADRIVTHDVLVCVSHLVLALANANCNVVPVGSYGTRTHQAAQQMSREALWLMDQAAALASPIPDPDDPDSMLEVYEHWAVTDWLADKLIGKGEIVDKDFGGLNVWARTTTGQMISMDAVIQSIAKDIHAS